MPIEFGPRITEGEWEGVNPRLRRVIEEYANRTGQTIVIRSGHEGRSGSKGYHPKGEALDFWIKDKDGNLVPHGAGGYKSAKDAAAGFGVYEQAAHAMKGINDEMYPNTPFRWGGYFSGGPEKKNSLDTMHIDIGDVGMAGGSFETGLYDKTRNAWAKAGLPINANRGGIPDAYRAQARADPVPAYAPGNSSFPAQLEQKFNNILGSVTGSQPSPNASSGSPVPSGSNSGAPPVPQQGLVWEDQNDQGGFRRTMGSRMVRGREQVEKYLSDPSALADIMPKPKPPPQVTDPTQQPGQPNPPPGEQPPNPEAPGPAPPNQPPSPPRMDNMTPNVQPPMANMQQGGAPTQGLKAQLKNMQTGAGGELSPEEDARAMMSEGYYPLQAFALLLNASNETTRSRGKSPEAEAGALAYDAPKKALSSRSSASEESYGGGRSSSSSLFSEVKPQVDAKGNILGGSESPGRGKTTMYGLGKILSDVSSGRAVDLSDLIASQARNRAAMREAEIAAQLRRDELGVASDFFGGGGVTGGGGGGAATTGGGGGTGAAPSSDPILDEAKGVARAVIRSGGSFDDALGAMNDHVRSRVDISEYGLEREKFTASEGRLDNERGRDNQLVRMTAAEKARELRAVGRNEEADALEQIVNMPDELLPSADDFSTMIGQITPTDPALDKARQESQLLGGSDDATRQRYYQNTPEAVRAREQAQVRGDEIITGLTKDVQMKAAVKDAYQTQLAKLEAGEFTTGPVRELFQPLYSTLSDLSLAPAHIRNNAANYAAAKSQMRTLLGAFRLEGTGEVTNFELQSMLDAIGNLGNEEDALRMIMKTGLNTIHRSESKLTYLRDAYQSAMISGDPIKIATAVDDADRAWMAAANKGELWTQPSIFSGDDYTAEELKEAAYRGYLTSNMTMTGRNGEIIPITDEFLQHLMSED